MAVRPAAEGALPPTCAGKGLRQAAPPEGRLKCLGDRGAPADARGEEGEEEEEFLAGEKPQGQPSPPFFWKEFET